MTEKIEGQEVPVLFLVENGGRAKVLCHLFHVHFRFVESSIYVEEERMLKSG